ncbi:MAG: DHH family phosphoesterase [Desulfuromonadales bacterium]|nr:DHH family phosphoesterase [Desulfuromonadales bacterium]
MTDCNLNHSNEFSTRLIEWLRGKGSILIVTHDYPDPDALAAACALQHLILIKTGQEATIAFGGTVNRAENRVMVQQLEIRSVCLSEIDPAGYNVVCMVDTQPGTGNNSLPADCKIDVVIDHHPLHVKAANCRWVDVRPEYGASATILFEYLRCQEVKLATKLATILFYAIASETQHLGRDWTRADREAYLRLLPLCNNRILHEISRPQAPRAYFKTFSDGLQHAKIYGDVLVFNLFDIDYPEIVAEIADFLMKVEGINITLGIGRFREEGVLSMRTYGGDHHAGSLVKGIIHGLGTAGGHSMTAGGQIRPMPADRAGQVELERELVRKLLQLLGRPPDECEPLVAGSAGPC